MRYQDGDPLASAPGALARLRAGEPVLSLGIRVSRTTDIVRMAAGAGYGVVWIDLEHSAMPIDCAAQMAATAADLGLAGWVRIPEREYGVVGRLLDGGASGIIAPKLETAEEAALIAAACRFPPAGQRSMIATLPQMGFVRMATPLLARAADDAIALQVLLESAKGIANVDAIAAVDGVDILGVGMNDLTADLGCPGNPGHPDVAAALNAVVSAARRHGKIAVVGGLGDAGKFVDAVASGFAPLIFAGIDTDILSGGLAGRAAEWRERFPATA